jgi:hypothetical protein
MIEENEEWRDIVGYEGLYHISNFGRVRLACDKKFGKAGLIMKAYSGGQYSIVQLSNKKKKTHYIHRLVAAAFMGPCPDGLVVLHNNGDSKDNKASNLRYGTQRENIADSSTHGTMCLGENHPSSKLTMDDVKYLRSIEKPNSGQLAKKFGVSRALIWKVYRREVWKHI